MRRLIIIIFLSKVWMHEQFGDSTPKLSAVFTAALPGLMVFMIFDMLAAIYINKEVFTNVYVLIAGALICVLFVWLMVKEDDFFLKVKSEIYQNPKINIRNLLILVLIFDLIFFALLGKMFFIASESDI